jgi:hypothetical protein
MFAYMDVHSEDGTQKRTHVYALTNHPGGLANRFVAAQDEWRSPPEMLLGSDQKEQEPYRYTKTLKFSSPQERTKRVLHLWEAIDEFNSKARLFFQRQGK